MRLSLLLCLLLLVVFLVRNSMVYHFRMQRLDAVSVASKAAIAQGADWLNVYEKYEQLSYDAMLFDFTKWTYLQFYPTEPR